MASEKDLISGEPGYLKNLNDRQKEAVVHGRSPLLILAGAGSGKTRVVTTRIAYMIDQLAFEPGQILAVTFTNKAAREMADRVSLLLAQTSQAEKMQTPVMVKTFHSFCAWLLRRNASLASLDSYFSIYDDEDSLALLKTVLPSKIPANEAKMFLHWISRAKDDNLGPDDDLVSISSHSDFPEMFRLYEEKLTSSGNVDFGGLIQKTVKMLRENPAVRSRLRQKFQVVLVDEYQDCNGAQSQLLEELTGPETWLAVVGDDDQSIYGFRGADVSHILQFPNRFKGTTVIRLEQNYRSTSRILDVAGQVVARNEGRLGKTLWTENGEGTKPLVAFMEDQDQEAAWVADKIKRAPLTQTAVLYRTNAQSRTFESRFVRDKIPYRIVGSVRFYEREEIKDILAWLKLLNNPRDLIAFDRVVNKPARGLGPAGLDAVYSQMGTPGLTLVDACGRSLAVLKGKAAKGMDDFLNIYRQGLELLNGQGNLPTLVNELVDFSGLGAYHQQQDEVQGSVKRQNLDELVNAASPFPNGNEGLCQFLENVELDAAGSLENDEDAPGVVTLITMHNTKGLEFDRVFVTGMEDGLFPREESNRDKEELEEERRLFYVAVTRARKELFFTTCRRRLLHGRFMDRLPSRFLGEIDPQGLDQYGQGSLGDSSGSWRVGQRVYHDDFGVGTVVKKWYNGGELAVDVRFDSGRMGRFIPAYTPLERISQDD